MKKLNKIRARRVSIQPSRYSVRAAGAAARWCGCAGGIYMVLPRHVSGRGTAAPRSVARQDLPRQRSPNPVVATLAHCRATMHGAAQAFGRAMIIGATKSVSLTKTDSVRFRISLQKMLKLKKMALVLEPHELVSGVEYGCQDI